MIYVKFDGGLIWDGLPGIEYLNKKNIWQTTLSDLFTTGLRSLRPLK